MKEKEVKSYAQSQSFSGQTKAGTFGKMTADKSPLNMRSLDLKFQ